MKDGNLIISLHDPHGRVMWANRAPPPATMEELVGSYPWDWVVEDERVSVKQRFGHCLMTGEQQDFAAHAIVHGVPMLLNVRLDAIGSSDLAAICRVRIIDPKLSLLTARELEVLRLTVQGKAVKEIGSALGMAPGTVEWHRSKAKKKLGFKESWELVAWASKNLW